MLHGLNIEIAINKTELILLNGRRKINNLTINIDETVIHPKNFLKYMGLYIDKDQKFNPHIPNTTSKTKAILNQLTRLTPHITGPTFNTRRVIMSAATSVLMYGAPIWGNIVKYKHYQQMLDKSLRQMALNITRAYRTTPTEAILVIAKIPQLKFKSEKKPRFSTTAKRTKRPQPTTEKNLGNKPGTNTKVQQRHTSRT